MCQKSEGSFHGREENTMMERFRIPSPTHFPPFSTSFEVSEARTSHPFPLRHQCSLIGPGVTLNPCLDSAEPQQLQRLLVGAGR